MVPSNDSPTNKNTVDTDSLQHKDESPTIKTDDEVNPESIREAIISGFELHLQKMKLKAEQLHEERMRRVRMVLMGSGMDNQQQSKCEKELDRIFRPLFT